LTGNTISVADASTSVKGLIKISEGNASNQYVIGSGVFDLKRASSSNLGAVQIGDNINVSSGTISAATASTSIKGLVQIGDNITSTNGLISASNASTSAKGVVQIGSGFYNTGTGYYIFKFHIANPLNHSVIETLSFRTDTQVLFNETLNQIVPELSRSGNIIRYNLSLDDAIAAGTLVSPVIETLTVNGDNVNAGFIVASGDPVPTSDAAIYYEIGIEDGIISGPPHATKDGVNPETYGTFCISDTTDLEVVNRTLQIKMASTSQKGLFQIGDGFSVAPSGSYTEVSANIASDTTLGLIKYDTNNFYLSSDILMPNYAGSSMAGIMKVNSAADFGINYTNGAISFKTASQSVFGLCKSGQYLEITNGVLDGIKATDTTIGLFTLYQGFDTLVPGTPIKPLEASYSTKGVFSVGNGFIATTNQIVARTALPSLIGLVQIDTTNSLLQIDANGVLSSNFTNLASTTNYGLVQPSTSDFDLIGGVLSLKESKFASHSNFGFLRHVYNYGVGTEGGQTVSNIGFTASGASDTATLMYAKASASAQFGLVKPNSSFSYLNEGLILANPIASASNLGLVKVGTGLEISNQSLSRIGGSIASASNLGLIKTKTYDNFDYNTSTGELSRINASTSKFGYFTTSSSILKDVNDELYAATATDDVAGLVMTGSGLLNDGFGVITLPWDYATSSVAGRYCLADPYPTTTTQTDTYRNEYVSIGTTGNKSIANLGFLSEAESKRSTLWRDYLSVNSDVDGNCYNLNPMKPTYDLRIQDSTSPTPKTFLISFDMTNIPIDTILLKNISKIYKYPVTNTGIYQTDFNNIIPVESARSKTNVRFDNVNNGSKTQRMDILVFHFNDGISDKTAILDLTFTNKIGLL